MRNLIHTFLRNDQGVAAIEYGLISALIAVAAIPGMYLVGTKLNSTFAFIAAHL